MTDTSLVPTNQEDSNPKLIKRKKSHTFLQPFTLREFQDAAEKLKEVSDVLANAERALKNEKDNVKGCEADFDVAVATVRAGGKYTTADCDFEIDMEKGITTIFFMGEQIEKRVSEGDELNPEIFDSAKE